jgi:hypothetical protein
MASFGCCDPAHRGATCRADSAHIPPATAVLCAGEGLASGAGLQNREWRNWASTCLRGPLASNASAVASVRSQRPDAVGSPQSVAGSIEEIALELLTIPGDLGRALGRNDRRALDLRLRNGASDGADTDGRQPDSDRHPREQPRDVASFLKIARMLPITAPARWPSATICLNAAFASSRSGIERSSQRKPASAFVIIPASLGTDDNQWAGHEAG